MQTIRVDVGKGYDINIGAGLLKQVGELAAQVKEPGCKAVIVTDTNVAQHYLGECSIRLDFAGFIPVSVVIDAGEESKNMKTLTWVLEEMARMRVTRNDIVIALGGGVVGDMAGFAAGVYMRGIPFIQVPTTLLAAVDSSVGGKTAVDLSSGKNLAGLFYQPEMVICDTDLLKTLPKEEYRCGMAEAVKTGVLSGEELFKKFEYGVSEDDLPDIIARCVEYKAGVVMRDEKELGERKLLNLGHTVGHAIEKMSGYRIKHGEAVAIGMGVIARVSEKMGWCDLQTSLRIQAALVKAGLPVDTPEFAKYRTTLAENILADKKRSGKTITIAVPSAVGACTLKEIEVEKLEDIIALGL